MINEIRGNTFDLKIDLDKGTVYIADQLVTDDPKEARIFQQAYAMGRNHKKLEIRMSLGV